MTGLGGSVAFQFQRGTVHRARRWAQRRREATPGCYRPASGKAHGCAPSARVGASGFTAWPGTPGTAAAGGALVDSAPVASGFSLFGSPTTATGRAAAKPVGLGAGADQEPGGRDAEQATLIAQLRV